MKFVQKELFPENSEHILPCGEEDRAACEDTRLARGLGAEDAGGVVAAVVELRAERGGDVQTRGHVVIPRGVVQQLACQRVVAELLASPQSCSSKGT